MGVSRHRPERGARLLAPSRSDRGNRVAAAAGPRVGCASAKTGANITELFDLIGQRVLKDRQPKSGAPGTSTEHADIRAKGSTASVNTGGSSPTVQLQASGTGSSNTKCPC